MYAIADCAAEVQTIPGKKEVFEATSAKMDEARSKFLSMKGNESERHESSLRMQADDFELERFDMDGTVAEVEANRAMWWQRQLVATVDTHRAFHTAALARLDEGAAQLDAVKRRLKAEEVQRLAVVADREARRTALVKTTLKWMKNQSKTVVEGWLEKQPFDLDGSRRRRLGAWQRRYFVLKSNGTLFYFKTKEDSENWTAEQSVNFNAVESVSDTESAKSKLRGKKHAEEVQARQLQFVFQGRQCMLKAETQDSKLMWMQALQAWVARTHPCQQTHDTEAAVAGASGTATQVPAVEPEAEDPAEEGVPPSASAGAQLGDVLSASDLGGLSPATTRPKSPPAADAAATESAEPSVGAMAPQERPSSPSSPEP